MNYFSKTYLTSLLILFTFSSCRKNLTGNPYIDRKVSVSEQQLRAEQKILAKQNKAYADQLEENKINIKKNNDAFFDKKYKSITKNKKRIRKSNSRARF